MTLPHFSKHYAMNTKEQIELTKTISQEARHYSTVIMVVGYVGLFSIWNFTREELENWQVLSVGFLATISLAIYMGFELYEQILTSLWLSKSPPNATLENLLQFQNRAREKLLWWQPRCFIACIATGALAVIILIYSFITGLLKLYPLLS